MRKLLRQMARAKMTRKGYSKVNKRMGHGFWRTVVNAYPVNTVTGEKMSKKFRGFKRNKKGSHNSLFAY